MEVSLSWYDVLEKFMSFWLNISSSFCKIENNVLIDSEEWLSVPIQTLYENYKLKVIVWNFKTLKISYEFITFFKNRFH